MIKHVLKVTLFWDIASCSLVGTDVSDMLTASMKRTPSKTSDYTAQNPNHIHTCHYQNLNSC